MSANKNLTIVVIDFMETISHTFYMSEKSIEIIYTKNPQCQIKDNISLFSTTRYTRNYIFVLIDPTY